MMAFFNNQHQILRFANDIEWKVFQLDGVILHLGSSFIDLCLVFIPFDAHFKIKLGL